MILKVTAIDKDTEANGEVFYEIISGNEENSFALASSSGEVTVARKLDYERAQSYKVNPNFIIRIFYNLFFEQ